MFHLPCNFCSKMPFLKYCNSNTSFHFVFVWNIFSIFTMSLLLIRSTGQVFCRLLIYWALSDFFPKIILELLVSVRKTTEVKWHFHHILSKVTNVKMYHSWYWPGWGRVCLVLPLYSYSFLPFTYCLLWRRSLCTV